MYFDKILKESEDEDTKTSYEIAGKLRVYQGVENIELREKRKKKISFAIEKPFAISLWLFILLINSWSELMFSSFKNANFYDIKFG